MGNCQMPNLNFTKSLFSCFESISPTLIPTKFSGYTGGSRSMSLQENSDKLVEFNLAASLLNRQTTKLNSS